MSLEELAGLSPRHVHEGQWIIAAVNPLDQLVMIAASEAVVADHKDGGVDLDDTFYGSTKKPKEPGLYRWDGVIRVVEYNNPEGYEWDVRYEGAWTKLEQKVEELR